jgi:23S rRNA (adenine2030-N6)-methyltransferase
VADFLRIARAVPGRYPGSPLFARDLARPGDRLVLCEKVPAVAEQLRRTLRGDPRAAVHLRDGYEAASLLPPAEKRGLVLIDPPFERTDELDAIADLIGKSVERFAGGIYAAWYPIKNRHLVSRCVRRVSRETGKPVLNLEFDNGEEADDEIHFASTDRPRPERAANSYRTGPVRTTGRRPPPRHLDASPGIVRVKEKVSMHACGLLVVNAPFGFEQSASQALQWLKPRLAQSSWASFTIEHGVAEAPER